MTDGTDAELVAAGDEADESTTEVRWLTDDEESDLLQAESDPKPVIYSGQDFDVEGLVRRMDKEDILVPTFGHEDNRISSAGFQRGFVWSRPQMDRFIESLLLGYPIPGIFLVKQSDNRYLVLDGQQRLRTLQLFYSGLHAGREFSLQNVGSEFKGVTYRTLQDSQRRTLDNAFIQATIVNTDGTPESLDAVYQIFERLNAGGTQLTPHEIRVALYAGPFIDYLNTLNKLESWRKIYGRMSPRIRDQEIVLRILALYCDSSEYSRPLKAFLNDFTARNRQNTTIDTERVYERFDRACALVLAGAGRDAVRPRSRQVNAALTEALMVGLMRRLDQDSDVSPEEVGHAVERIKHSDEMQTAISRSTADEESVRTRLRIATECFSGA